jgi:hypothetical protein
VLVVVQDVAAGLDAAHPERLPGGAHRRQLAQRAAGQLQDPRSVVSRKADDATAAVGYAPAPTADRLDGASRARRRGRGGELVSGGVSQGSEQPLNLNGTVY